MLNNISKICFFPI